MTSSSQFNLAEYFFVTSLNDNDVLKSQQMTRGDSLGSMESEIDISSTQMIADEKGDAGTSEEKLSAEIPRRSNDHSIGKKVNRFVSTSVLKVHFLSKKLQAYSFSISEFHDGT